MSFILPKPLNPDAAWKRFDEPKPYVSVSGFALDKHGFFPIMYRSDKCRSAKNCFSLPSGLHEIGLTLEQQFGIELYEELNLAPKIDTCEVLGTYENISTADGYHWVLTVMAIMVESLDSLLNKEPDKHPEIRKIHVSQLTDSYIESLQWGPNLKQALYANRDKLYKYLRQHTA